MTGTQPAATRRPPSGAAVLRAGLTEAVVDAVFAELAEHGYGRLSMQRVAGRAGVGKSALYRRWSGKQAMVIDIVGRLGVQGGPPPDTGTLHGDLRALLEEVRTWMTLPRLRGILPDLLAETGRNPDLADAFRERLAEPRRSWGRAVLERAAARGEIDTGLDRDAVVELVLDLLGSAPFWRIAVHGGDIPDVYLDDLATLMARGLGL